MIIDANAKSPSERKRATRITLINARTGAEVKRVVAINTLTKKLTVEIPKDERADLFNKTKVVRYGVGDYILRDKQTGLEWPATEVIIPCLQRDGVELLDCICFNCLPVDWDKD